MLFDLHSPAGQGENVLIVQHQTLAFGFGGGNRARGFAGFVGRVGIEHLLRFTAAGALYDGLKFTFQQRLVHHKPVRVDAALDHRLPQPPGAVDQHHVGEAAFGIQGKQDAGAAEVRAHHLLHTHRKRHLLVGKAVLLPIGDGAVGVQGGQTGPAAFQ